MKYFVLYNFSKIYRRSVLKQKNTRFDLNLLNKALQKLNVDG